MITNISEGVKISVEVFYQPDQSNPANSEYLFAYRITIKNINNFPIQLLRRHWIIADSNGETREVEGEGVVGNQPVIEPNNTYQYISACALTTEIGKMHGMYLFENTYAKKTFSALIPEFHLQAPFKLN
jgi:ApaG protein